MGRTKKELTIAIDKLKEQTWEAQKLQREMVSKIRRAKNGDANNDSEKKEARQFIRKCPADACEGFLSSAWKCGVCNIWACPTCFEAKGFNKDETK